MLIGMPGYRLNISSHPNLGLILNEPILRLELKLMNTQTKPKLSTLINICTHSKVTC